MQWFSMRSEITFFVFLTGAAFVHGFLYQRDGRPATAWRRELDTPFDCLPAAVAQDRIVGKHGVDLVGDGFDQAEQEVARGRSLAVLVQLDKGELAGPVDRHEHVEIALLGAQLGHIDVKIADGVCAELAPFGFVAFELRQAADVMALQAAV
jgi:hypothetical protein